MKRKTSKKFTIILISLLSFVGAGFVFACAWGPDEDEFIFSFFAPEVSQADEYQPFFRSFHSFYGGYMKDNYLADFNDVNVDDWSGFFVQTVADKDLNYLLYKSRIGEIDTLIFYIKDAKFPAPELLKENSIHKVTDKTAAKEFLYYLGFAKRCEPYVAFVTSWWSYESEQTDTAGRASAISKLVDGAGKSLTYVKNDFIRQRYYFQVLRLLFKAGSYERCLAYYDLHKDEFTTASIRYRAMGYAAGAYKKIGNFAEANYRYSLIYDNYKLMRTSAYLSFHPQEEEDWKQCIALAKNDREKQVLWQLLGIYADPLRAMKAIYAMNPKSELLDLLLVRAVNIEEEKFAPARFTWEGSIDSTYALKASAINPELFDFIKTAADKENTAKPYLWNLAAGYLSLVKTDYLAAEKYLAKAKSGAKNDTLVEQQVHLLTIVSAVEQVEKPGEKFEAGIVKELKWLKSNINEENVPRTGNVYDWALHRLSVKYKAAGDIIKAECLDVNDAKKFYSVNDNMMKMIGFMDKKNKTEFDDFILGIYPYSKADIFEMQAVNLVYSYQWKEAAAKFAECAGSGDAELWGDPFTIYINDCHDCDHANPPAVKYTKLTFVKSMIELEEKAVKDPKNAAKYYFELANGYYNMTYFGNARLLYMTDISPREFIGLEYGMYQKEDVILDCDKAEEYYKKAMSASADIEFKTRCCFMAAKCEQNRFFINKPEGYEGDFKSGVYFKMLKSIFSGTKYYQEIINECGYFSTYLVASQ